MKSIHLLLAVHHHQPVGNLRSVMEQAWARCYDPFLTLLEKHPCFRLTLHYSGSLMEWLEGRHPEFFPRLQALVARSQVELLSGGFYEPLLPFIPEKDAVGQVLLLNQYLSEKLGTHPKGLWLAERVWNTNLPKILAPTGLQYTVVDDSHFRYSGLTDEDMFGHYVTEHEGFTLSVFPINKRLRYAIPFRPPEETMEALRFWATDAGSFAATYADDGEKFGLWPGTFRWVFEERWLERFISLLEENREWARLITFSEYMDTFPPQGRIYLPSVAYDELMEWALPPLVAMQYQEMLQKLKQEGKYEKFKPYLRGGSWENFLLKYAESNHMHKRMLYVSNQVHRVLPNLPAPEKEQSPPPVLRALWRAQDNCAYWHGLFGGLYLNYLRHSVYQNLITAESLAGKIEYGENVDLHWETFDLDKDLQPEILISSPELGAVIKPSYGGALIELDSRPQKFNFTNVLTRRPEAYHRKMKEASREEIPQALRDLSLASEEGWVDGLMYDWYNRYSFMDHFLGEDTTFDQFRRSQYPELGDFVNQPYLPVEIKQDERREPLEILLQRKGALWKREGKIPTDILKRFLFMMGETGFHVEYEIVNRSSAAMDYWFGVEINLILQVASDPQGYFHPGQKIEDPLLVRMGAIHNVQSLCLRDEAKVLELTLEVAPVAELWHFPLETISQSESGLEKTFQGTTVLFHWRFSLSPGERKCLPIHLFYRRI